MRREWPDSCKMRRTRRCVRNPPLYTKSRRLLSGPAAGYWYGSASKATGVDQPLLSDEMLPADPAVPVMAEITLLHWVKGASVT